MFDDNVFLRRTRNIIDRILYFLGREGSVINQVGGEAVERTVNRRQTINSNLPEDMERKLLSDFGLEERARRENVLHPRPSGVAI